MPLDGSEAASSMLRLAGMNNPMRGIPIIGGGGANLSAVPGSPGYADRINTGDPDEDILDLDPRADPTMLRAEAGARAFVPVDRGLLVGPARPEYRVLITPHPRMNDTGMVVLSLVTPDLTKVEVRAELNIDQVQAIYELLARLVPVVDLAGVISVADGRAQVEASGGSLGSPSASDANSSRPASRA